MLKSLLLMVFLVTLSSQKIQAADDGLGVAENYLANLQNQEQKTEEGKRKYANRARRAMEFLASGTNADGTSYGITDDSGRSFFEGEEETYNELIRLSALANPRKIPDWTFCGNETALEKAHAIEVRRRYENVVAGRLVDATSPPPAATIPPQASHHRGRHHRRHCHRKGGGHGASWQRPSRETA